MGGMLNCGVLVLGFCFVRLLGVLVIERLLCIRECSKFLFCMIIGVVGCGLSECSLRCGEMVFFLVLFWGVIVMMGVFLGDLLGINFVIGVVFVLFVRIFWLFFLVVVFLVFCIIFVIIVVNIL